MSRSNLGRWVSNEPDEPSLWSCIKGAAGFLLVYVVFPVVLGAMVVLMLVGQ